MDGVERETVRPTQFLYWFQLVYGVVLGAAGLYAYQQWSAGVRGIQLVLLAGGMTLLTLIFVIYLQNLHKANLHPDYSKTCYACKLAVNRYSEFCEHCGADQIERSKIGACPECQATVYEGVAYCPTCGDDLRNRKLQKV